MVVIDSHFFYSFLTSTLPKGGKKRRVAVKGGREERNREGKKKMETILAM